MKAVKALMPWGGKPLLAHQIDEVLATRVCRLVLVLGAHEDRIRERVSLDHPRLTPVQNPHWAEGKSGSIRRGAEAISDRAAHVAVLAVDQPASAEVLETLFARHEASGADGSVPVYRGKGGHPLLLAGRRLNDLRRVSEATRGLKGLVRTLEGEKRLARLEVEAACVIWNLNRPGDVERLESRLAWARR